MSRARRLWETFRELATVHQNSELERLAQRIEERYQLSRIEITPEEEHAAIDAAAEALRPRRS